MSRLEELIAEFCPDGVEHTALRGVCTDFIVPMRDRPKKFDGDVPWCRIEDKEGQIFNNSKSGLGVSDETIKKMNLKIFPTGTVICSCSASIGAYAINTQPLITNQTFIGLVCGEKLYNKYLLYFMETQTKKLLQLATTGTIPYISRKKFEDLIIPLPPLSVQHEIVRILDNFTGRTSEIIAELTAELTARKKQYEYYRNRLLTFEDSVQCVSLGSICDIFTGGEAPEDCIKGAVGDEHHPYPIWANGKEVYGFTKTYKIDKDAVVISSIGSNTGAVFYKKAYFTPIIRLKVIIPKVDYVNTRYLFYAISVAKVTSKNGSVPNINANDIKRIVVSIPSLEKQEKIVTILDYFDTLCNDLTCSLPAEIEARRKQYEYYRDKLLTFKEVSK